MPPQRKLLLTLAILLAGGSLTWTAGYGLHIRSERFRANAIADLAEFFELPCDVARIRPSTFSSRVFEDVRVWLPDRRDEVFRCREAVWHEGERNNLVSNRLDLIDGLLNLGTDRWQLADYQQVLKSGLEHNFEDLHLDEINLRAFEMSFVRGAVAIRCRDTSGILEMKSPTDGVARLVAYELNGQPVSQGVQIDARFCPKNGIQISEVNLRLPEVPLTTLDLARAIGTDVTRGRFAGSVHYRGMQKEPETIITGLLHDADLAQLTARLPLGPLSGVVSISLRDGRFSNGTMTHLRGEGEVDDLKLAPFARALNIEKLSGSARFNIHEIDLALGHVQRLVFDGGVRGASLAELLGIWGKGSASGELTLLVNSLRVRDDRIEWGDIKITATPPKGQSGFIDRDLLLSIAEKAGGLSLPDFLKNRLPETIPYAEFGVRLQIDDNKLRILGTHGSDGDTILTIELLGQRLGVLNSLSQVIDLTPWLDLALERARTYDPDQVREWWRSHGMIP